MTTRWTRWRFSAMWGLMAAQAWCGAVGRVGIFKDAKSYGVEGVAKVETTAMPGTVASQPLAPVPAAVAQVAATREMLTTTSDVAAARDRDRPIQVNATLEVDNETIARLATGIKRFELPRDANFIRLYKKIEAYDVVAGIYENRRLYPKAAKMWKKAGYAERVEQIVGNWGQFESSRTHPEGQPASVEYRFRNGEG